MTLQAVHAAVRRGLTQSVHDLSDGGLAVALAEMALAGDLGARVSVDEVPVRSKGLDIGTLLFAESPSRFLVEVAPDDAPAFEAVLSQVPRACIGEVTSDGSLTVLAGGQPIVSTSVDQLKATWQATLAEGEA